MYLPDVNVWVALAFSAHTHHVSARTWFGNASSAGPCHFCRLTQLGFLRIVNNPAAIPDLAVTQVQAWTLYDHFLAHPQVRFADEPVGLEAVWRGPTQHDAFSPKVWNDAYLAAFAQAAGFEVVSFDQGFAQYPQLRHVILA